MQDSNNSQEPPFYVVSMGKFSALFIATLGNYVLYWFYKNWSLIGKRQQRNTYPILRAIFFIFFIPQLCKEFANYQKSCDQTPRWNLNIFSIGYIGSTLASVTLSYWILTETFGLAILWLQFPIFFFQFYLTYQFQLAVNYSLGDPFGKVNQKFSMVNHIWIVVGLLLWFDKFKILYLISTGQVDTLDGL